MTSILFICRPQFVNIPFLLGAGTATLKLLGILAVSLLPAREATSAPVDGRLRTHPTNPRYFTNDSGEAVYLTGSHTWDTIRDFGPKTFDYTGYLDFLEQKDHNFSRLWAWDLPKFQSQYPGFEADEVTPFPWLRNGAGTANDGRPKFDLNQFNQAYFDRLRSRVQEAGNRGVYTSVMLFEGWHLSGLTWGQHPFDRNNNVNGINGDANEDGNGREIHSGTIPAVTAIQEAYVRKVVDTLNDLDNVLYEIANESGSFSTSWQYGMINTVKDYQATKSKQHPVGMTFQAFSGSTHSTLLNSPADWISPGQNSGGDWLNSPPVADGLKVILTDSDHIAPLDVGHDWIWKSFSRGLNPILMDDLSGFFDGNPTLSAGQEEEDARLAMGFTLDYAQKMDLAQMLPRTSLCSTNYCLANPGSEYLVYQPGSGAFDVTLETGTYEVEWMHPLTGVTTSEDPITAQSGSRSFTAPFGGDAVLYLKSDGPPPPMPEPMMNLVVNGEFEDPDLTQTFGGLIDLPNEAAVPGWSNANPSNATTTYQGVTLTLGETLEVWSQGFNTGPTAGSDAHPTGHHAEVQVFDVVGADVLTQSFVIPAGSSPATFSFDHWDRVVGSNDDGVLAVRVEGSQSGVLVDTILPQSQTIWTPQSFSNLAVAAGETVTLSFSGALAPSGSGDSFPHVDQVRFEVGVLGDFNGDFKVDGFDFLAWQRGFGDTYDETNFADWEDNFGTSPPPLSAGTANVPEPSALLLVVLSMSVGAKERVKVMSTGEQPGHYLIWDGKPILPIGDSTTQGWMESGLNFDQEGYLDALSSRGINVSMIWSYIATDNLKQIADARIGYDAPEVLPWQGSTQGNTANLQQFNQAYFDRLASFVSYAESKDMLVLITVHDGWTKTLFNRHPFNASQGNGPLTDKSQYVELADFNNEMPAVFDPAWNWQEQNQYFQERFADKLITTLEPYSNVMFEMFNEGEWYDQSDRRQHEEHFLKFFRTRTDALLLTNSDHISGDDPHNDPDADIISFHGSSWTGEHQQFVDGFNTAPAKPYFMSEQIPDFNGQNVSVDDIRQGAWELAMAGAGWVAQNDTSFSWDPNTSITSQIAVRNLVYDQVGHVAAFFNELDVEFWKMAPDPALASTGIALANLGSEYVVYANAGGVITVDLSAAAGETLSVQWYDPRTGVLSTLPSIAVGLVGTTFTAPDGNDWVLRLKVESVPELGADFDNDGDVDSNDLTDPVHGWEARFGVDLEGFNFLEWQRQFGSGVPPLSAPYRATDYADWEANFGTVAGPIVAATVEIPEPSALLLGAMASFVGISLRCHSYPT